jgi:hypothetical protein
MRLNDKRRRRRQTKQEPRKQKIHTTELFGVKNIKIVRFNQNDKIKDTYE